MGASLEALDPGLASAARDLDAAVAQSGLQGRFTSTLRTRAEQSRLYRRYMAGSSEFPAAPPGASAHEFGLAFDYVVEPQEYQADVGALWVSWGGGWAPSDRVHFELPGASAAVMAAYNASQGPESSEGLMERAYNEVIGFFSPLGFSVAQIFLPSGPLKHYIEHPSEMFTRMPNMFYYLRKLGRI